MANLNEGLAARIAEGQKMEVALDFEGWQPGGLTSDLVRDGQYMVQIMDCQPKPKKNGDGVNANIIFKIIGPNCEYRGKQLVVYHPIPIGDSQSPDNIKKKFLHNLFYSIVSGVKGDEAADSLKKAGVRKLTLGWFVNRIAYIKVRETTDNNARPVGEVQFYITKAQYESSPGPAGAVADDVDLSKSAAVAIANNPVAGASNGQAAAQAQTPVQVQAQAQAPAVQPAATVDPINDLLGS